MSAFPAADLLLHCPTNLVLPPGVTVAYVDADLYDICERIKEISPALSVLVYEGQEEHWTHGIAERCADGVERLVFKVGPDSTETPELDARVLRKLQRLMAKPLDERLIELEKQEAEYERAHREAQHEELYETVGRPMWSQLEKSGFIDRPVSYPKVGVAKPGKAR